MNCANQKIRMSRKVFFSSAHLYKQDKWTKEKNAQEFGKCFSRFGHGHNYTLEAFFEGEINPTTGLLANLIDVEVFLKNITNELDHQHLNFEHPYFKKLVPTTENMAVYIYNSITEGLKHSSLKALRLYKVKLFEEPELFAEVTV